MHAAPSRIMIAASAQADLLVLGRNTEPDHGPGSAATAHAALNHAHCPVAIIPE